MNGHSPSLNGCLPPYYPVNGGHLYSHTAGIRQDRHNISPGAGSSTGRQSLPPDIRMPVASPPVGARPVPITPPPPNARRTGHSSPEGVDGRAGSTGGGIGVDGKRQMLSRNLNGTLVMTSQPSNESELQLYRVLQRANLLHYYDTFISQGGDDVQQLCEAGEEEFLEIMALVGMASKPLHVRRLQKALQEWVQNPGLFQSPLVSSIGGFHSSPSAAAAAAVIRASGGGAIPTVTVAPSIMGGVSVSTSLFGGSLSSVTGGGGISVAGGHHSVLGVVASASHLTGPSLVPTSVSQLLAQSRVMAAAAVAVSSAATSPPISIMAPTTISVAASMSSGEGFVRMHGLPSRPRSRNTPPSSTGCLLKERTHSDTALSSLSPAITAASMRTASSTSSGGLRDIRELRDINSDSEGSGNGHPHGAAPSPPTSASHHHMGGVNSDIPHPGASTSPMQIQPVLVESQIQRIADAAAGLVKSLPDLEPKQPNAKKKICKELEIVMTMPVEDDKKMEEIRKFSAIYGRFDCKRKQDKPLTLHEVSVNEAAAQICKLVPAMLTRRDELFPLARQVVRDSGYQYSKGHSRSTFSLSGKLFNGDEGPFKRMRFSEDSEITQRRRERLDQITEESRLISDRVDELRTAGGSCRTAGDLAQLQQISQQLELLQNKQQQLNLERDEHQRYIRYSSRMSTSSDPDKGDTDDETSQRSYSNASSPSASSQGPTNFVLSASGGQIIAVQNPALSLSGAFSSGAGRGSPPTTVHQSASSRRLASPNLTLAAGTHLMFKQEPSSPPPVPISYAVQPPHSRD